jgi:putative transposase
MIALPSDAEIEGAALGSPLAEQFAAAPPKARATAIHRTRVLRVERQLRDSGLPARQVYDRIRAELGEPKRTVVRWRKQVDGHPAEDWAALLLPGYRATTTPSPIHPDAWEHLLSDYHRPQQPAFEACYRRLLEVAPARGWEPVPSLWSLRRRYDREIDPTVTLIRRQGVEAYEKCLPTLQRDKSDLAALEWVNADGHRFDVFVRWPVREPGAKPRITRPVIVAWHDVYSGKILSWRIDETENQDAVRLAFGDMVRDWGIPEHITIDNGHAFASKRMTGGLLGRHRFKFTPQEQTGIYKAFGLDDDHIHFTIPYRGRSKPIERAFRDLCEEIARHPSCAGAYTGNAPHRQPEDYGTRAVDVHDFIALVGREIERHNARAGRRSKVCRGRSFDKVFLESYQAEGRIIRRATDAQLRWLLLPIEGVRVPRQGPAVVRLLGNQFFHPTLAELRDQRVTVRFDPMHVQRGVYVFADGQLEPVCHAECIEPTGFGSTDAARRIERARRALVKAKKLEAAALGTVPVAELAGDGAPRTVTRKTGRVIALDFSPVAKPKAAHEARATDDLLFRLGDAALASLEREAGA